jgi:hypothetical protein
MHLRAAIIVALRVGHSAERRKKSDASKAGPNQQEVST